MLSKRNTSTLLALYLILHCRAPCGEGTLACHTSGKLIDNPIQCDFMNHYTLSLDDRYCFKYKIEGCILTGYDFSETPCLICKNGLYFDYDELKCIPVPYNKRIANCKRYNDSDLSCDMCESFYSADFKTNVCTKVKSIVDNCHIYNVDSTCRLCNREFYLFNSECIEIPKIKNCQKLNNAKCEVCREGYFLDRTRHQFPVVDDSFFLSLQQGLLSFTIVNLTDIQKSVCALKSISNCAKYISHDTCGACDTHYFMTASGECEKSPVKRIAHCAKYSDSETCSQCEEYFFVSGSPTICHAVTLLENCLKFKPDVDQCHICIDNHFYLEINNICVERTLAVIKNCLVFENVSEGCHKCAEGYSKTIPYAKQCLANLKNCKASGEVRAGDSGASHTCTDCEDGSFFIDTDGKCKPRTITHCETYSGTTNNCIKCGTGFWLDARHCLTQEIQNCKHYVENMNECDQCLSDFYYVSPTSCLPTTVTDCVEYTPNTNTCVKCSQSKYLFFAECKDRDQNQNNCEVYVLDQNQCSGCQPGYFLRTDFTCMVQELPNCVLHIKNKNECERCSLGYYMYDHECLQNDIENCASYIDNQNECASCAKGFYFDKTDKVCNGKSLEACIEYLDNVNVCSKCQAGTYLNDASCVPQNKANCIDYEPGTNQCVECAASHFLIETENFCQPKQITNCTGYDASSGQCINCTFGFKVSNKTCVPLAIPNCVSMGVDKKCANCVKGKHPDALGSCVDNTVISGCRTYKTDENTCAVCEDGKYSKDAGSTCTSKNIEHCIVYTNSTFEEICVQCEPTLKKYLTINNTVCQDISNPTDCYSSPGDTQDICSTCLPGVILSGNVCLGNGADVGIFDVNCAGHSNSKNSTNCEFCNVGFVPARGPDNSVKDIDLLNCLEVDYTSGNCRLCKLNFELTAQGTCTLYTGSVSAVKCNQHEIDSTKFLTEETDCQSCPNSFFLNFTTCTDRGRPNLIMNCGAYSIDSEECLGCQEGSYSQGQYYSCTCVGSDPSSVSNCILWGDDNNCKGCDANFKLTPGSPGSCDQVGVDGLEFTYNQFMDPTGSKQGFPNVLNCKHYAQVDADTVKCIYCNIGFVGMVDYDPASSSVLPFAFSSKKRDGTAQQEFLNTVTSCESVSIQYKNSGTDHNSGTDCELGYQVSGKPNGYACLKCLDGTGYLGTVNQDSTSTSLGDNFPSIHSCTALSSSNKAEKLFQMMGLLMPDTFGHSLRYTSHFPYDTCVSSPAVASPTSKLLYMLFPNSDGHLINSTKMNTSLNRNFDHHYCVSNANIDTTLNCQFFILKHEIPEASITINTYDFKGKVVCGACQPGYRTIRLNNAIGSCIEIDPSAHDTTVNNNTWLNAAQTPVSNWKWDISTPTHFLDLAEPVTPAQSITNCYAVDTTSSACVFCKEGFFTDKGECSSTTNLNSAYSIGRTNFEIPSSIIGRMTQFSGLVVKRFFPDDTTFTNLYTPHCQCSSAQAQLSLSSEISMCRKMPAPDDAAADCRLYKYGDNTRCHECQPSHTKNTFSQTCITKIANCKESEDGTTCSTCEDAYIVDGTGCRKHNCLEWDPTAPTDCLICDEDKAVIIGEYRYCSDDSNLDTECKHASPTESGMCMQSKDPTKIPYNIFSMGAPTSFEKTEHVTFDSTVAGYGKILNDYISFNIMISPDSNSASSEFYSANTFKHESSFYKKPIGSQPADTLCMKVRPLSNCKTKYQDLICIRCNDYFQQNLDGTCDEGSINNCQTYDSVGCTKCEENYFMDSGSCILHTAENCLVKSSIANSCSLCSWDRFGSECNSFRADNCETRKSNEDKCDSCADDYYLDSSLCKLKDEVSCKTWNSTDNKCASCSSLFLFDSSEGTCTSKTASKCVSFDPTLDECLSCSLGHIFSSRSCVWGSAHNCGTFLVNTDFCDTCSPMSYKDGNDCILRKAPDCKMFDTKTDGDTCAVCSDPTYMSGSICTQRTAKKCMITEDSVDRCKQCLGDLRLTSSFTCIVDISRRCDTYAYDNSCATCVDTFWLDTTDDNTCKTNTAKNCKTYSRTKNECDVCKPKYYLNSNDNNVCEPHKALECSTYSPDWDECLTCLPHRFEIIDEENYRICLKYESENCQTFSPISDECTSCVVHEAFVQKEDDIIYCEFRTVKGCKVFTIDEDTCSECYHMTYLKDGKCLPSTEVEYCESYSTVKNQCTSCGDLYFKSQTKNECWHIPDGIVGCSHYSSRTTCVTCDSSSYLYLNTCKAVSTLIEYCLVYASEDLCLICRSGSYYDTLSRKCILTNNPRCKYYKTKDTCISCLDPYVFNPRMEKCQDSGISNCLTGIFSEFGNICAVCKDGYIVSENKQECELPTDAIQNCKKYETKTKCLQCKTGYYRSEDKEMCVPIGQRAGANCAEAIVTTDFFCEDCFLGYTMDKNGDCIKLANTNCLVPTDDLKDCLFCLPLTYMNKYGVCELNSSSALSVVTVFFISLLFSME